MLNRCKPASVFERLHCYRRHLPWHVPLPLPPRLPAAVQLCSHHPPSALVMGATTLRSASTTPCSMGSGMILLMNSAWGRGADGWDSRMHGR